MKADGGMWEPEGVTITPRSTSPSVRDTHSAESDSCLAKGHRNPSDTHIAEEESAPSLWQRLCHRTWFLEILAIAFSLVCFGAIVVILGVYHNSTRPEMPYGLTLNAIVSALAVASKSALLCAVAGAISQLKWCWFKEDRNLKDLQSYDDASRGPAGSAAFIFSARPSLATVGALTTVLTLVFDPFVQQVIHYPSRPSTSVSSAAVVDKASIFSTKSESFQFLKAINAGIWADASDFDPTAICPGGDCQWPAFQSMGWCSKCADVTSTAVLEGDCNTDAPVQDSHTACTIHTKSGQGFGADAFRYRASSGNSSPIERAGYLTMTERVTWLVDRSNPSPNQSHLGIAQPLLVLGYASLEHILAADSLGSKVIPLPTIQHAEECALTPCLRTYNLGVADGTARPVVSSVNYGIIRNVEFKIPRNDGDTLETCWQPTNTTIHYNRFTDSVQPPSNNPDVFTNNITDYPRFFNTAHNSFCGLSDYSDSIQQRLTAASVFKGQYNQVGNASSRILTAFNGGTTGLPSDSLQAIWATNLSYVVENVAASLTKFAVDLSNETMTGNVTTSETYVQVDWPWLALPICLEVLGLSLLLAAILHSSSSKVPLWKSSLLPLLYHGIESPILTEKSSKTDICVMERHATGFKARLASTAHS